MAPTFTGIHHLKFPVSDLSAGIAWYERALGATRHDHLDHHDREGNLFAVILSLPGLAVPVELRLAPAAAAALAGYDPVTFGVAGRAGLDAWVDQLDSAGIEHSPVISGFAGQLIEFQTPDGLAIRIYTDLPADLADVEIRPDQADLDNPAVNHELMASDS